MRCGLELEGLPIYHRRSMNRYRFGRHQPKLIALVVRTSLG